MVKHCGSCVMLGDGRVYFPCLCSLDTGHDGDHCYKINCHSAGIVRITWRNRKKTKKENDPSRASADAIRENVYQLRAQAACRRINTQEVEEEVQTLRKLVHQLAHRLRRGETDGDIRSNTCKYLLEWIAEVCPDA